MLMDRGLLKADLAENLLSWKHSGFSIDNSVRIFNDQTRENLAEYLARPPLSLKKIRHEPFKSWVLFHTTYSEYFKQICCIQHICFYVVNAVMLCRGCKSLLSKNSLLL